MKTQEQFAEEILDQCMNGTSVSNLMTILEEYRIQSASQIEPPVMPMLTEIEVRNGWEGWLNNSFKYYKKDFSDKLRKSNKRSGVIETPKKWIENYYKELLEVTERYLNASKHSA